MSLFVLIPGAGADPAVYYRETIAALAALGHEAIAPPLPREDDAATPSDHAEAVVAALPSEHEDLVVVGHSLGAFTATLVAARTDAAALVLLSPMIPRPGESAGEWGENVDHDEAIADLRERFGSPSEWSPEALEFAFYHDVDEAVAAASHEGEAGPGSGFWTEPLPLDAWPAVPTRVLAGRDDRLFPLAFQRRVARERLGLTEVDEIDGGHLPMLARPAELARRLVEISGA